MVLFGEGYVYFALLADVPANQLLLECIDERVAADGQVVILCLAAVKWLAVNKSFKINDSLVTVGNRSVLNVQKPCILLLYLLKLCIHILSCHGRVCLLNFNALIFAQGNLWPYCYKCGINEWLVLADLLHGNFRSGHNLQSALIHGLHAGCVDGFVSSILIKNAFAIHLFNHGTRCFAFTEAWNIEFILVLIEGFLHCILKLRCIYFYCQFGHVFF